MPRSRKVNRARFEAVTKGGLERMQKDGGSFVTGVARGVKSSEYICSVRQRRAEERSRWWRL